MDKNKFSFDTVIGDITVIDNGDGRITDLILPNNTVNIPANLFESDVIKTTREQLSEYFEGSRKTFNITMEPKGTEFQLKVWEKLCEVPYGTTISYGELAKRIGNPSAFRAVGMALNRNPIAIIAPCHRIIGSDGSMTGFAGGIDMKKKLLRIEGVI